jgi:hypothetical protein
MGDLVVMPWFHHAKEWVGTETSNRRTADDDVAWRLAGVVCSTGG